jgi:hypothetical protein
MLLKVVALVGAVISGIFALVGWSLARVSHGSDERIQRMFEEHLGSGGTGGDTRRDL